MPGHKSLRRAVRRLERRGARRRAASTEEAERWRQIKAVQRRCRFIRAALAALGHDPDQCAILVNNEQDIAAKIAAGPAIPRPYVLEDRTARERHKFLALIERFRDPATPPPDFGNESLNTIWAYALARSPPLQIAPMGTEIAENRDSDAGG